MSDKRNILTASILANVGLLVAVFLLARSPEEPIDHSLLPAPSASPPPRAVVETVRVTHAAPARAKSLFDWQTVESEDYRKYIDNLRSIGCPEETIRDIIIADVEKLFAQRKKEGNKNKPKFEFWKTGNMFAAMLNKESMQATQELNKEKRDLLKALLGNDLPLKATMASTIDPNEMMNSALGFLDEDKQVKVMEAIQSLSIEMAEAFGGGVPDKEDIKKYLEKQKEMEQKLAAMLTPEEFDLYQLTMSQTANVMRMQLDGFDPNEKEFRELFKLQKSFDDEFGGVMGLAALGPDEMKLRAESEKLLKEDIRRTLGDERFEEYERVSDWAYKPLAKVLEREGLDKSVGAEVWNMKKVAEEEAIKIHANSQLAPDERNRLLMAIGEETRHSIQAKLGDKGFDSYAQGQGGFWLKNLDQVARTAATATSPRN